MARHRIRLSDGRGIDYVELGERSGTAALYLHGTPSSASEARWLDAAARAHGVRLVAPDRPGYLGSAAAEPASLDSVARDLVGLVHSLDLGRFAVVGFSGGAGPALAVASVAPDDVTVVHLGGAIGSLNGAARDELAWWRRAMFGVAAHAPALTRLLVAPMLGRVGKTLQRRLHDPEAAAAELFEGAARGAQVEAVADYIRRSASEELRVEITDYVAATRATSAVIADLAAVAAPWPFELGELRTRVELWHGRDDPAVPVAFAEALAAGLPDAHAHLFDGEGHFVFHTHADQVVESIRAHASPRRA